MNAAIGVPAVDDVRIERVGGDGAALPGTHRRPVAECDLPEITAARHCRGAGVLLDRKSTRLNSSHSQISYAVFCLKKKKITTSAMLHAAAVLACPDATVGAPQRDASPAYPDRA